MITSWRYWLALVLAFAGLVLLTLYLVDPGLVIQHSGIDPAKTEHYSSFIGSFVGGMFSLAGVFLLFETLIRQHRVFQHQQFETRFYELIKIHNRNIDEIQLYRDNELNPALSGRQYFSSLLRTYNVAIRHYKLEVLNLEYEYYYTFPEGTDADAPATRTSLYNYNVYTTSRATLPGYGEPFVIDLFIKPGSKYYKEEFGGQPVARTFYTDVNYDTERAPESIGKLYPDESAPEAIIVNEPAPLFSKQEYIDLFWHLIYYGTGAEFQHFATAVLDRFRDRPEACQQAISFYKKFSAQPENKHLEIYLRHLFNTLEYIDTQDFLTRREKHEYAQILRSQLSVDELAVLLFFSTSTISQRWKLPAFQRKHHLITEYALFLNLPADYVAGIDPEEFFPSSPLPGTKQHTNT